MGKYSSESPDGHDVIMLVGVAAGEEGKLVLRQSEDIILRNIAVKLS